MVISTAERFIAEVRSEISKPSHPVPLNYSFYSFKTVYYTVYRQKDLSVQRHSNYMVICGRQ